MPAIACGFFRTLGGHASIVKRIMAEKKKMSVAEIMAAARKADSKGQAAAEVAPTAAQESSPEPVAEESAATVTGGFGE